MRKTFAIAVIQADTDSYNNLDAIDDVDMQIDGVEELEEKMQEKNLAGNALAVAWVTAWVAASPEGRWNDPRLHRPWMALI